MLVLQTFTDEGSHAFCGNPVFDTLSPSFLPKDCKNVS